MNRCIAALLLVFTVAHAMVIFDHSLLIDSGDVGVGTQREFDCPDGCRVYSPSSAPGVQIMDHLGNEFYSLDQLSKAKPGKPISLAPNNYTLKSKTWDTPEFTLYVVQKGAPNYDVPVYTSMGKISVVNQQYLTFLSDGAGFLITTIRGDLINANVSVYTTGADSVGNNACRPAYVSRSFDNAARSNIGIRGPIATIDFGSSSRTHYATFTPNYESYTTELDSSSTDISPGYVGCGNSPLYTNNFINKVHKNLFVTQKEDFCFQLEGAYSLMAGANALTGNPSDVVFLVNDEKIRLSGNGTINRSFNGNSFNVEILWDKQGQTDHSQFAFQLDLLPKGNC